MEKKRCMYLSFSFFSWFGFLLLAFKKSLTNNITITYLLFCSILLFKDGASAKCITATISFSEYLPHPTPPQLGKEWLGEQLPRTWSFSNHWHRLKGLGGKRKLDPENLSSFCSNNQWERYWPFMFLTVSFEQTEAVRLLIFFTVLIFFSKKIVRRSQYN